VSIQNVDDLSPQDSAAALFVVASFDSYVMMKTREKKPNIFTTPERRRGFCLPIRQGTVCSCTSLIKSPTEIVSFLLFLLLLLQDKLLNKYKNMQEDKEGTEHESTTTAAP
jgi:hypothetical protein